MLYVVVPAYNEGQWIHRNLEILDKSLSEWLPDYRIILVDDGSTDNTSEEAYRAAMEIPRIKVVSCPENLGKGNALRVGVEEAGEQGYIAFLDADLDLPPYQLKDFFELMVAQNVDVVIGSKMHRDSKIEYPVSRKIISFIYYLFIRVVFGLKIHDSQTGIKLFRAECIKEVMPRTLVKRFAYDIEVLAVCNHLGYKIVEAPIELVFQRSDGFGRIHFQDMFNSAWDTLAVFYRLKILKYYDRGRNGD